MEHLPVLIPLSHNTAPVSQSASHQATQPVSISRIRPINNLIQNVQLSFPPLFSLSLHLGNLQATIVPTRPITWWADKIWGLGSCHSSVDVWATVLPLKVHMHEWRCMGLILLHSPLCFWDVCGGKGGCWLKGKQGFRDKERGEVKALECCCWFLHTTYEYFDLFIGVTFPKLPPPLSECETATDDVFLRN